MTHHAVHTLHPATSHGCIFPQRAVQGSVLAKEPDQQLLLLRPEENTEKTVSKGARGGRSSFSVIQVKGIIL